MIEEMIAVNNTINNTAQVASTIMKESEKERKVRRTNDREAKLQLIKSRI